MTTERIIWLHRKYVKESSLRHLNVFAEALLKEIETTQPSTPVLLKALTPAEQVATATAEKGLYTKAQLREILMKVKAKACRSEAAVKEIIKLAADEAIEL